MQVELVDDAVIACPTEDIDTASARRLADALADCLDSDADHLILDLSEVRYLDSAGIDMLLRLGERLRQRRSHLSVVIPRSSPLTRVAEIVDLPAAMPVFATVADARGGRDQGDLAG
jgi:anti-sigma B factor antagonist